jgi:hypothetical protein
MIDEAMDVVSRNAKRACGGILATAESAASESVRLSAYRTILSVGRRANRLEALERRLAQIEEHWQDQTGIEAPSA